MPVERDGQAGTPVAPEGGHADVGRRFQRGQAQAVLGGRCAFHRQGQDRVRLRHGLAGSASTQLSGPIQPVALPGAKHAPAFEQTAQGLQVTLPADMPALAYASALNIS
jgi:alpha-L-fucosidase